MQGGIFTPIPPAAATIAVDSGRGYPRFTMEGIMMEPMAAVSAADEPETPEKKDRSDDHHVGKRLPARDPPGRWRSVPAWPRCPPFP